MNPMDEEVDCFLYEDRVLCEECGQAAREDIHDGSGKPAFMWEHAEDHNDYPQRTTRMASTPCAECGIVLGDA